MQAFSQISRPRPALRPNGHCLALIGTLALAHVSQAATFGAPQTIVSGQSPAPWVQVADVNLDGRGDVLHSPSAGKLDVLFRNADGSYTTVNLVTTGVLAVLNAAALDVNDDGLPDVIAYVQRTSTDTGIRVIRQTSAGVFDTAGATHVPVGAAPAPQAPLRLADLDGDGRQDLVVAWKTAATGTAKGRAGWMRNPGTGALSAASAFFLMVFDEPCDVAVGDFNRDGSADVAVADNAKSEIRVCPGPTFTPATTFATLGAPRALQVVDSNRDGWLDLLVAHVPLGAGGGTGLRVYPGSAAGFTTPNIPQFSALSFSAQMAMAAADFDLDGRDDVAIGTAGTGSATQNVALDRGTGTADVLATPVLQAPSGALAAFDDDGDGDADLLCGTATGLVRFANIMPHRALDDVASTAQGPAGSAPSGNSAVAGYAVGDFNGDGRPDMASATASTGEIRVLLNSGGTGVTSAVIGNIPSCRWLAAADIDGDGDVDLAAPSLGGNRVIWFSNGGNGTSWTANTIPLAVANPVSIAAADVNHDGAVDLVTASATGGTIQLLEQSGGTWTTSTVAALSNAMRVEVADVIPGGWLEIVAQHGSNGSVSLFRRVGGSWSKTTLQATGGPGGEGLAIADFDGNGLLDVASGASAAVYVMTQTVPGTFAAPQAVGGNYSITYANPGIVRGIRAADIDLDGRPEIIAAMENTVAAFPVGVPDRPFTYATVLVKDSTEPQTDVAVLRFDGDAVPDILHHSPTSNRVNASILNSPTVSVSAEPGWPLAGSMNYPVQGQSGVPLFRLAATHHGWPGDADVQLRKLSVRLLRDNAARTPFDAPTMAIIYSDFSVWHDATRPDVLDVGNGDTLLTTAAPSVPDATGLTTFSFGSAVTLSSGTTKRLFLASQLNAPPTGYAFRIELPTTATNAWSEVRTSLPVTTSAQGNAVRFVQASPTLRQSWRSFHFSLVSNIGPAADEADPDGDGIPNLLEYALGLDPKKHDVIRTKAEVALGGFYYSFWPVNGRNDVGLKVTSSANLSLWQEVASRSLTGKWLATKGDIFPGDTDGDVTQQVYYTPRDSGQAFFRLQASELAP